MEGLCPCGHEPTGSIVPVSELVIVIAINTLIQMNLMAIE